MPGNGSGMFGGPSLEVVLSAGMGNGKKGYQRSIFFVLKKLKNKKKGGGQKRKTDKMIQELEVASVLWVEQEER